MASGEKIEMTIDEALEFWERSKGPPSNYHIRLLFICGLAFCADALEVNLLYFMSNCAGKEWSLSDEEAASISGIVFAGELFGSLIWGGIADRYGRRIAFLCVCSFVSIGGFLSAFSPSFGWLLGFRALVGIGVGGGAVAFDLMSEFLPLTHRGKFLLYTQFFWTVGSCFVNGMAWLLLNTYGWRVLTLVTAVPVTLASILAFFALHESPRWLLIRGRVAEAEAIIEAAAAMSNINLPPFTLVVSEGTQSGSRHSGDSSGGKHKEVNENSEIGDKRGNETGTYDYNAVSQGVPTHDSNREFPSYWDLISTKKICFITVPLILIWLGFGFTYNGLVFFTGRLFSSMTDNDTGSSTGLTCSFEYQDLFISSSSEFLGVLVALALIDRVFWGRSRSQSLLYVGSGVCVLLMSMKLGGNSLLILSLLARLSIMAACSITWVCTPELYPTNIRATGHSICNACARVAAFSASYVVINSSVSIFQVGILLGSINMIAAIAASCLPETSKVQMDAIVSENGLLNGTLHPVIQEWTGGSSGEYSRLEYHQMDEEGNKHTTQNYVQNEIHHNHQRDQDTSTVQ